MNQRPTNAAPKWRPEWAWVDRNNTLVIKRKFLAWVWSIVPWLRKEIRYIHIWIWPRLPNPSTPDPTSHHYHHYHASSPNTQIRSLFKQQQQVAATATATTTTTMPWEIFFVMTYRHLEKDSFDATITSLCFGSCVVLMCNDFHVHTHKIKLNKIDAPTTRGNE
jgi:hypothetical protein